MSVPDNPRIYHIVHVDRLTSIATDRLWCDAEVPERTTGGTGIGMPDLKARRLELGLRSHPELTVGACVPFYFCPRSVMLYVIHKRNHPQLTYRGGQEPIVHLEANLLDVVDWAGSEGHRWAFTLSNASSFYAEDRCRLDQLGEIDWAAVKASDWRECKEAKQAEFLVEKFFPWDLVRRIGVFSEAVARRVSAALPPGRPRPSVEVKRPWYY